MALEPPAPGAPSPPLYRLAGAPDPQGDDESREAPTLDGPEMQLDEFVGANPDYDEEEEERRYFRRKRLGVIKNVLTASIGAMLIYSVYLGLLQMQLILHYDETYREVKYGTMGLPDIDSKMLMGINMTPVVALLYTPVLLRFFGTKWMMFLAVGVYALFVSTNYWERYYTLVPSAVALGMAVVPLWAALGNYITRMAQKYHEFVNYKQEVEHKRPPRGAHAPYLVVFQVVFYSCFHLSFACAQLPMFFFLNPYLYDLNHTLNKVQECGINSSGILSGFNKTVLQSLPRSLSLIVVESVLMAVAFMAMLLILGLCGAAYRPTEEIDLRSVGWGHVFQLPFKHVRDYRLRHLFPFFVYSGADPIFACTALALSYGVCSLGLERLAPTLLAYGLASSAASGLGVLALRLPRAVPLLGGAGLHLALLGGLACWAPAPRSLDHAWALYGVVALWGVGSALNKTGLSTLLGILYEDKERQDFIFTIYHWGQALAAFAAYLGTQLPMKAKVAALAGTLVLSTGSYVCMEWRLHRLQPFRLPRIPRPQPTVRGYRYLDADNSDASGSDGGADGSEDEAQPGWGAQDPDPRPPYEQALGGGGGDEAPRPRWD
ncbi:LOW QUALITY PROTEIN: protein unc-93 homolog B1 [Tachyglossus aculeatus]|uniref:LOW QUALITY PROTEIN: protein unc-93 homolog B1 n=1 Tax=Tachyglossus aculeatus TaxID=9261 RepID=UPI0018F75080|nr:LOW QUALITY PROTEIN: protein unc-93 homolog B1 [Tachyglossus aculeatus]